MWCPGIAALLVQFFNRTNKLSLGWRLGKAKYLLLSFVIPIIYGLFIYLTVWMSGLGEFSFQSLCNVLTKKPELTTDTTLITFLGNLLPYIFFNLILGSIFELGEEIGWRGFLVPHLAKVTSFTKTALFSGFIWSFWHYPLLIFGDYNLTTPNWFAIPFFTVSLVSVSFIFAWLRLKSGSLWTGVILHSSHNFFIQNIFTPLTIDTGITKYIIDEFGIGLSLTILVMAYIIWRRQSELDL